MPVIEIDALGVCRTRREFHEREARMWAAIERILVAAWPNMSTAERRRWLRFVRARPDAAIPPVPPMRDNPPLSPTLAR